MILTASPPLFTINVFHFLSSFKIGRIIWKWYESVAIQAFTKYKQNLETNKSMIAQVSLQKAQKELKRVDNVVKSLTKAKKYFDLVKEDESLKAVHGSFLQAYNALLEFQELLENKIHPHYYAQLSESALAKAWNSPEDDHWDNY